MKKIKRVLGIVIAIALMLTSMPYTIGRISTTASAATGDISISLDRPSASMSVTEVTRVAYAQNSMQPPSGSNAEIVKATPSGMPYVTGTYASAGYAGETPAATTVTFTPGVQLDSAPTIQCSNTTVKMSDAVYSNGTYTWTVLSGTALVNSTLIFTVTYVYSEVNETTGKTYSHTYMTRAVSYVESIATPAGINSHKRTYENWGLGSTNKNRSYLASILLGKNTYGSVYNGGSGDGTLNFAANWSSSVSSWTSSFGVMKDFSDSDSSRNYNVAYKADSNRPYSTIYMDKSIHSTLSDLNLRFVSIVPNMDSETDMRTNDTLAGLFVTSGVNQTFAESDGEDDPSNDASAAALLGIGNPTVSAIKTRGSSSIMYLTGAGLNTGSTSATYTVAIKYQTSAGWSNVYVGHSHSFQIVTYNKGDLRTLIENIQNTDPTSLTTSLGANEYKGHNPQSWYYESGYEDFLQAFNAAKATLANPKLEQSAIDKAKEDLLAAYKALKLAKANYTLAKVYYDQASALEETNYTLSSWAKLQSAMSNYSENYSVLYQPTVDKVAIDIQNAMNNLEYKKADYTEFNKRLEKVTQMYNDALINYGKTPEDTYNNWTALVDTLTNSGCAYNEIEGFVVSNYLPIIQQATVDGYVVLIDGAISRATLKGADLTEAMKAENAYKLITLSYLVDDSATQLTNAYDALVALHNADLEHQADVDNATDTLNYWLQNLEYKPADTERAITLLQTVSGIDRNLYDDFSAVDTAVSNLESKLDLDIRYQSEINSAISALQSAIDRLTANSADYTDVDTAIARANEIDRQITEQYALTYGFTAADFYSNWSTVEGAINNVIRKLDATQQSTVDGFATTINSAIDALNENVADYSAVTALQTTANDILTNNSAMYESEGLDNLLNSLLAVKTGYLISRQSEVDAFATDIQNALDGLVYVKADYTNVNAKLTQANTLLATGEQYEIDHPGYYYFTPESKADLEVTIAGLDMNLNTTQQSIVNGYVTQLQTAISALKYGPADYDEVDLALAKVPTDTSLYTTLSVSALNASVKAVKRTYTADKQATVDGFVTKIEKAIAGLKYKTADYSLVTTAKNNVPASDELYTVDSWALLRDALDAVVYNREIIYQDEVNLYATAIEQAIAALKYKPANYSAVEQALSTIPVNINNYTDESVENLNSVTNAINYSLDITQQTTVDGYVTQINTAIENLELKKADYSQYYKAKEDALKTIADGDYTTGSVDAVNNAINNVDLTLDITNQETVDGYVTAILDAVSKLVYNRANYKEFDELKNTWDNYPEKEYYDAQKIAAIDKAFEDADYNLDGSQQSVVDGYVTSISQLISKLTYKSADYSKVTEALEKVPSDMSLYSTKTASAVTVAVNNVEYGLDARSQATVDGYATAIENAVSGLTYKSASYTPVYSALSKVPSNKGIYTDESIGVLNELLVNIPTVTDIREQYILDAYAQSILDAIDALEIKPADYSRANQAIENANELIATGWYTQTSVDALNTAIDGLTMNLDITHQSEVDLATENIVKATNELAKKLANYTELQNLLDLLDNSSSEIYNYTYSNYDEIMGEISDYRENVVSENMQLTIDKQSQVDEMADYIQKLIDSLIKLENGEVFSKKEGSTTVFSKGYIYGLKSGLTKKSFENNFVTMENVDVSYENVCGLFFGTGTKVIVKSHATGVTIGEYTMVIFGDVDGNSKVNAYDRLAIEEAINNEVTGAVLKAADLNGDGLITGADLGIINSVLSGASVLNHATGEIN